MDDPNGKQPSDLLFAWLSPIETHVDQKMQRPKSPSLGLALGSPLVRAKTAAITGFKRTFSGGQSRQDYRQRVREAQEACLWLKAAGFPQYVQMFHERQFPINLSKFQVEKDHRFLEQSSIDALIRRLNILNRCADVMEDTHSKDDESDDELSSRALSEFWVFKRKGKKWSRKSKELKERNAFGGSDSALFHSFSPPMSPTPPMLVSELRTSLTDLDRQVKCFSFLPGEEFPPICVDQPLHDSACSEDFPMNAIDQSLRDSAISDESAELNTAETGGSHSFTNSGGFSEYTIPRNYMDNFAVGILTALDSNMKKLWHPDQKSHSLPDVFSASQLCNGTLSTSESVASSTSISITSALDSSKDNSALLLTEDPIISVSTPFVNVNGHREPENLFTGDRERDPHLGSSGTMDSSSPGASELEEKSDVSPRPRSGRVSMEGSMGEPATYPEVVSPNTTLDRSSLQRSRNTRWHSFQRAHSFRQAFKPVRTLIPIEELSCGQIGVLRKLSLVKMTALLELHKAKINVSRILKGRKQKFPDSKHKKVFGVPLSVNVRTTGQSLPISILNAMDHLRLTGLETKGLFRRAAGKARVEQLKEISETNPVNSNFEGFTAYDVADMIKLYFRELPESLFSSKFSEILIAIHDNIPEQLRLQALQSVMVLIPDDSREALQCLFVFLNEVAEHSDVNQMNAQNLAVCFAPTLFTCSNSLRPSPLVRRSASFRRNVVSLSPNLATSKEVTDSVSSSQCLCKMITQCARLFMVPADMMQVCKFSHLEFGDPVPYHDLGRDKFGSGNFHSYVDTCVSSVLKEAHRKFKGWVHSDTVRGVDIFYVKPKDGIPLRIWRGVVEIPATTDAVLRKLWTQRHVWDGKVVTSRLLSQIDYRTEIYQYVTTSMAPFTDRDHCVLRSWRPDQATGSYVLVATSVSHPSADLMAGIRATELAVRYLIEPVDSYTTRLTYLCRVDSRGRSADYYNSSFGPYLASSVHLVKDAFHELEYLETPV